MAAHPVLSCVEAKLESNSIMFETVVRASGRITSETAVSLKRKILDLIPSYRRIVLDLSNVDYIDSCGVGMLLAAHTHAKGSNCELEISNPRPRLRDRLRNWFCSVFEGHEEMLGMTPD
jgi:anti-sigma B factor antagonist